MKTITNIDDVDDDFGFSAVSEDELKQHEQMLAQEVRSVTAKAEQIENTYKEKLDQLYRAVMPLLKNLKKDSDKEYLYWPNRVEKVEEFIKKIDKIVK